MPFCDQCGNERREGAKFCDACGAPVPKKSTQKVVPASTPSRDEIVWTNDRSLTIRGNIVSPDYFRVLDQPQVYLHEIVLEEPVVSLVDGTYDSVDLLLGCLESVVPTGRPLALIARRITGKAEETLYINHHKGTLASLPLSVGSLGEKADKVLQRLPRLVGASVDCCRAYDKGRRRQGV